jgi:hypothetical protein
MGRRVIKWIRNIVLLLLLVFGCPGSFALVVDFACNRSIETWLPIYPNAELVSAEHNFIRVRGLGTSFMVYHTPDAPDVVEAFYRQNIDTLVSQNTPRGMGGTDFFIEDNPDGEGSLIVLYSRCIV